MAAAHVRTGSSDPARPSEVHQTPDSPYPAPQPHGLRRGAAPHGHRRRGGRLLAAGGALLGVAAPLVPEFVTSEPTPTVSESAVVVDIPSNFDVAPLVVPGHNGGSQPASAAHEGPFGTGNFRTICHFSHFSYDDPIVYPGQPGKAHLHMFFGNTTTDASSTYESLRRAGDGTCNGKAANRSGYWVPAILDGSGRAVIPEAITTYYKSGGRDPRQVRAFPAGLKMIAGADMNNPNAVDGHRWYCEAAQNADQKYLTIPECPANQLLIGHVVYPDCWNGRDLDSPDHRSHMAYAVRDGANRIVCPSTHPVALPEVSFTFFFKHTGSTSNWYVSSDRMGSTRPNGSTFHADWFGAWDPAVMNTWITSCINGMLDCQQGQMGNGTSLVWPATYQGPNPVTPPTNGANTIKTPTTTAPAGTTPTSSTPTTKPGVPPSSAVPTTQPGTSQPGTSQPGTSQPGATPVTTTVGAVPPAPKVGPQSRSTWQPLILGSTGEYVRRVQSTLARIGYPGVTQTSILDATTAAAVLKEQQKYPSLADTGGIDWDTGVHLGAFWAADSTAGRPTVPSSPPTTPVPATTIAPVTTPPVTTVPTTTVPATTAPASPDSAFSPSPAKWTKETWKGLSLGSTGEYVRRAQRTLRRIGHSAVTETGIYDTVTRDAVLAEQKKWTSLADTGVVDWPMGKHLGIFW